MFWIFFKLKDNSNINKELNLLAGLAKIDKRVSRSTRRARKHFGKSRPANQRHAGL